MLRNTLLWVLLTPPISTIIGLVYAVIVDRSAFEKFAKALLFLPMAISLVGASIIWKFVYDYKCGREHQIGLLNADPQDDRLRHLPLPARAPVEHVLPDRDHRSGSRRASR